jgi:hypothetical protein
MIEPITHAEPRTGYAFLSAFLTGRFRPVTINPTLRALMAAYTGLTETGS